uniref:G-protein coupled receptors family 1 profile domain-containing protein n=1 Tax=Meloidogyne floridensis TaxID=298350 RepID=A0A915NGG3_9BILA
MQSLEDNTKKERIRILAVCLVSLIPCPWYLCMYKLNLTIDANVQDTTTSIIISALFNTSLTILQCIEEICLIIISEDFRLMTKNQFIKTNTTTKVSTNIITVKQNSQQRK